MELPPPTNEMLTQLRSRFSTQLKDFATSPAVFKIMHTSHQSLVGGLPIKTLYVLDSSFNPPSKAHLSLARGAYLEDRKASPPKGILFLLATENADKKPKPAEFEDRLVMMVLMAGELSRSILSDGNNDDGGQEEIRIDVGVTKKPFFVDKAMAIDSSEVYGSDMEQVHLIGYDTLTRIFDAKYYPPDQKLEVLDPFLQKHRLRATYRVDQDGSGEWGSVEDQDEYIQKIGRGERQDENAKKEWIDRIEMVRDAQGAGISSTDARRCCKARDWDGLRKYVSDEVRDWIRERGLYQD